MIKIPKLKVYLDTSAALWINEQGNEAFTSQAKQFWNDVHNNKYDIFYSEVFSEEISKPKHSRLNKPDIPTTNLEIKAGESASELAEKYRLVLPYASKEEDRLHIAIATLEEMQAIVSLNLDDMVNNQDRLNEVNQSYDFPTLSIVRPMDLPTVDHKYALAFLESHYASTLSKIDSEARLDNSHIPTQLKPFSPAIRIANARCKALGLKKISWPLIKPKDFPKLLESNTPIGNLLKLNNLFLFDYNALGAKSIQKLMNNMGING